MVTFSASLETVCPSFGRETSAPTHLSSLHTRWYGACDGSARVPCLPPTGRCSVLRLVRLKNTDTLRLKNHTTYTCICPCPSTKPYRRKRGTAPPFTPKTLPCVGPRGTLDTPKKKKISCHCLESNPGSSSS